MIRGLQVIGSKAKINFLFHVDILLLHHIEQNPIKTIQEICMYNLYCYLSINHIWVINVRFDKQFYSPLHNFKIFLKVLTLCLLYNLKSICS
jgi:hypothetical protein